MSFPFLEDLHALHNDPLCSTSVVGWTLWDISASPGLSGYVLTVCSSACSALYARLGMLFFIFVVLQKCPGLQENWRFTLAQARWYLGETYVPAVSPWPVLSYLPALVQMIVKALAQSCWDSLGMLTLFTDFELCANNSIILGPTKCQVPIAIPHHQE